MENGPDISGVQEKYLTSIYLQYRYLGQLVLLLRCLLVRELGFVGADELCVGCI